MQFYFLHPFPPWQLSHKQGTPRRQRTCDRRQTVDGRRQTGEQTRPCGGTVYRYQLACKSNECVRVLEFTFAFAFTSFIFTFIFTLTPTHSVVLAVTLRRIFTHLNVSSIIVKSTNLPSSGTTSDVGGMISASSRKNTVSDSRMDMLNETCNRQRQKRVTNSTECVCVRESERGSV